MDRPSAYRSGPAVGGRGVGASVDDGVTHLKTRGIAVKDESPHFRFENLDEVAVFAQIVFGSVNRSGQVPMQSPSDGQQIFVVRIRNDDRGWAEQLRGQLRPRQIFAGLRFE